MQARWLPIAILSCVLLGSAVLVSAQDRTLAAGQITGQVRFADTKQPAFNVLVSCDSVNGGLIGQVQTDRNGKFTFTNLALAPYTITVRQSGYIEQRQNVELMTSPTAFLQFQLQPDKSTPAAGP